MIYDSIVIGTGLFGSLITRGLRDLGRNVLLLGNKHAEAGSPPAACLMKPEWFSKFGKEVHQPALDWLYQRFIVHNLPFAECTRSGGIKASKAFFIEPKDMLLEPDLEMSADSIQHDATDRCWYVQGGLPNGHATGCWARQVVVAAGVWSQQLIPWFDMGIVGRAGSAYLFPEWVGPGYNFMTEWAPYKQIVGFQRGDGFWINDGSAIMTKNWDDGFMARSWLRCREELAKHRGKDAVMVDPQVLQGIRPYTPRHKPCLLQQVQPGLWVAVGAAKNGTLLGGYCARIIQEQSK